MEKTYECIHCKYTTNLKTNYNRHLGSVSHIKKITGNEDGLKETNEKYIIRLLQELKDARSLYKPLEDENKLLKIKIKKLENPIKIEVIPIQIEEKPKENSKKFDMSDRFS